MNRRDYGGFGTRRELDDDPPTRGGNTPSWVWAALGGLFVLVYLAAGFAIYLATRGNDDPVVVTQTVLLPSDAMEATAKALAVTDRGFLIYTTDDCSVQLTVYVLDTSGNTVRYSGPSCTVVFTHGLRRDALLRGNAAW